MKLSEEFFGVAGAFLFCAALSLLFWQQTLSSKLDAALDYRIPTDVVYTSSSSMQDQITTRGQILVILQKPRSYDILIHDRMIRGEECINTSIALMMLQKAEYHKSYQYSVLGDLTIIRYW